MASKLAYALITPYSLVKSRTGGIIGRMLSLTDLTFVGTRMFAPSDEMVDKLKASYQASSMRDISSLTPVCPKRLSFGKYVPAKKGILLEVIMTIRGHPPPPVII